ncbi:hypothetical protein EDB87DRAFT_1279524 [Lactarius vividus]|nr:hypothetical protein EDB87DRAFT_1279524 [Lactarius vividus]
MTKTHAMLETAGRDGPLLNICRLGYLGMMAVPFEGSSLRDTDFKKLLDLLQKMMEDRRLTLASTPVWEELGRLRNEVHATSSRSSNEDKTNMQKLLAKIDAVYMYCPSSTQDHHPSDHGQSQAPRTSAVVQPNLPPRGLQPGDERFSYASTPTAVGEDIHDSSPADDDHTGIAPAPSNYFRSEPANLYHNAYPYLPSQIAPSGAITRPFSASFLPTLSSPRKAPTMHPQALHPFSLPHLISVTMTSLRTAAGRFTILRGGVLPVGRQHCHHYTHLLDRFLPLRQHRSFVLIAGSIRIPLLPHQ